MLRVQSWLPGLIPEARCLVRAGLASQAAQVNQQPVWGCRFWACPAEQAFSPVAVDQSYSKRNLD